MRKLLLIISLISLIAATGIFFSYPIHEDTPPPYYVGVYSVEHLSNIASYTTYFSDGTKRIYLFNGNHPTGSRLLDKNDVLLEENTYGLAFKKYTPVLKIVQAKYFTFSGRLRFFVLPCLLVIAALSLLALALLIIWDLRLKKADE